MSFDVSGVGSSFLGVLLLSAILLNSLMIWDDFQSMLVDGQFVACSVVVSIDVFDGIFGCGWMVKLTLSWCSRANGRGSFVLQEHL